MKPLAVCILLVVPCLAFCSGDLRNSAQDQPMPDSNDKIQDTLQSTISGDPVLNGADVQVQVDDQNITLTGTVETYAQHQRVLQLIAPYKSARKVVDRIRTSNPQTKYARLGFLKVCEGS